MELERTTIETETLDFAAVTCGDGDRLAVCFHGFPDDPRSFAPLLERLAEAGYTAVAPWMRGYGETECPPLEPGNFSPFQLGADVLGVVDALADDFSDPPLVVGHDWGATAVTAASVAGPDAIGRAVVMAVPPNFAAVLDDYASQSLRSWYMTQFQIPGHAEEIVRRDDFALIERLWGLWSPGLDPDAHLEPVKETLATGQTVEAAMLYYRDFFDEFLTRPREARAVSGIQVPTLVLAGRRDGCIGADCFADATDCYDARADLDVLSRAGHFLHVERPDAVADRVLEFVAE